MILKFCSKVQYILFVLLFLPCILLPSREAYAAEIGEPTVTIQAGDRMGHAVCIWQDESYKYFATCRHIIDGYGSCIIYGTVNTAPQDASPITDHMPIYNCTSIYTTEVSDLAFLRIPAAELPDTQPAAIQPSMLSNEAVCCKSLLFGSQTTMGTIVDPMWHDENNGMWVGRTNIPIKSGFSGSGVWNASDELLGIIYQYTEYTDGRVYSECIKASDIAVQFFRLIQMDESGWDALAPDGWI